MNRKSTGIMIFVALVLWIMTIFYFSSQPSKASHAQSGMMIGVIKKIDNLFDITDTKVYEKLAVVVKDKVFMGRYTTANGIVRKSAHFGIYFILGMICSVFGYFYTRQLLMGFLVGVSLPVVVAVLDEFNQGFVGRTSSLSDVIIDGTGALVGTVMVMIIIIMIRCKEKYNNKYNRSRNKYSSTK